MPPVFTETFVAFGPQTYVRATGTPAIQVVRFSVNTNTMYSIRIRNGGVAGDLRPVSSAVVRVNGLEIFGPGDFNQNVSVLERPVSLRSDNELSVELRSAPGSGFVVEVVGIDDDDPLITGRVEPAANPAGWNSTPVVVTFACSDATSGIASCPEPVSVAAEGANQEILGTAIDRAGNTATASAVVNLDRQAPVIGFTFPADGQTVTSPDLVATGVIVDTLSGLAQVRCGSTPVVLEAGAFACPLTLVNGPNTISVSATDNAGNSTSASIQVTFFGDVVPPVIAIGAPLTLSSFNASPISVNGTIDDPAATVTVNGVPALVNGIEFVANGVELREGPNTVTVTATDPFGNASTASISVVLDTTPPTVLIDAPVNGAVVTQSTLTVTGMINDMVTGTVNGIDAVVAVNGMPAVVANRTFMVIDLALRPGPNSLVATARDAAGNFASHTVQVTRQTLAGQQIARVSGDNQTAVVGEPLFDPLVVALTNAQGQPVAGRLVSFVVSRGDGSLISGTQQGRAIQVPSDASGRASALLTVGTRSGAGNNRATASAVGFSGEIVFSASSLAGTPAGIKTVMGDTQRGVVGQALPEPFVVFVHDETGNPLQGVQVTFAVKDGDGTIQGFSSLTTSTDDDGRAAALVTLGPEAGVGNNVIEASFEGLIGRPATLVASGVLSGRVEETVVTGVVLDNTDVPLEGVVARVFGTALTTKTDAQGRFRLTGAPVGTMHLVIDGTTTTRPGEWPALEFELTTIAGTDNTIGRPIYLVPLDSASSKTVGGPTDVTLTMKDVPGLTLTVFANSATFADGSKVGRVLISQVHSDKVPMAPIEGAQPRLVWTVQPAGVMFDPPARITYPNVDGFAPGRVVNVFSFDHDLGEFVSIGTATVSADGSVITSDPGVGIRKAGWGYPQGAGGTGNRVPPATGAQGPVCPLPGGQNPVKGSNGQLAKRSRPTQGDGRFGPNGEYRTGSDGKPRRHYGIDIVGAVGTSIGPSAAGTVTGMCTGFCEGQGNSVTVTHDDGTQSKYWHLDKIDPNVKNGSKVGPDDELGKLGTTGNAAGTDQPHLHFEIRDRNGKAQDPTGCVG